MSTTGKAATGRRRDHLAIRLVAEHQPLAAGGRFAIGAGDDFAVCAADAERQRANENRALRVRWLRDVIELCGVGHPGKKRKRAH